MITKKLLNQYYRLILHDQCQKYALAVKQGNEVKYPHQKNYLTEAELEKSIKGDRSLGIMLSQDKTGLTKSGCIDIDCPRDAQDLTEGLTLAKTLQETALKSNLRGYIEYSGNRGYHFWIFSHRAITASLMQSVLRTIANQADFEALEIFPNSIPESKCIKLPSTIHLKSDRRCGFISSDFDPLNPNINLNLQSELMADFIQNSVFDLTAVANTANQNLSGNNSSPKSQPNFESINQKLSSFGSNHPSCINHLISNGVPLELDYNQVNVTLARYCLSRGYELNDSLPMAEAMAKNTSDSHSTSKDFNAKVANFKSVYKSAKRQNYQFQCSYILANRGNNPLSSRGCIGAKCLACDWINSDTKTYQNNSHTKTYQNNSSNPEIYPYNSLIFEAMIKLLDEGKELCKSNILAEVENNDTDILSKIQNKLSDSVLLQEREILAYLLTNFSTLTNYVDLPSIGFSGGSNLTLSEYLTNLANIRLPSEKTIKLNIEKVREKGIKRLADKEADKFKASNNPLSESLDELITKSNQLLKKAVSDIQLESMKSYLPSLVDLLYSQEKTFIPSPSPHLNNVLNGGFMPSKLYVLGSPPGSGKSTFCSQCADFASLNGAKVVYASYEMSREQLFINSLARLGNINSALIEGRKFLDNNYHSREDLERRLKGAIQNYQTSIADNQIIIEADSDYTPSRLKAIAKKVEANLIIVDYLQLLSSGDQKLDNAYQETLRVSKIATELKRLARDTSTAVIAISDINKDSYLKAMSGNDLDMGSLRDSFKIAHSADVILLLQSGKITMGKGENKTSKDQLDLLADKYPERRREIDNLKIKYSLDKKTSDTYSRLTIVKNRGGKLGEPCFKYSKALHNFECLDFNIQFDTDEEVI